MQSIINSDTFLKIKVDILGTETGRKVALYRRKIQTLTMNQLVFFLGGGWFDFEKKQCV